jgi:glycosyltransferase involved in cell wall biosynthesis
VTRPTALVITGRPPWPLDDGGIIGLWQFTWSVARANDTTLLTLHRPGADPGDPPEALRELGLRVVRVPHAPPWMPLAALRGWLGPWPYTLARYRNAAFDRAMRKAVRTSQPRFALLNHLHMATYADALEGTALVLRQHNVESVFLARLAETLRWPARAYATAQVSKMRIVEGRLCERMDLVLAIHDGEAAAIRALSPRAHVEVVPVGIDFARFNERRPTTPPIVLLTGSFEWPPNAEGARRFLEEGWPRLCASVPGVRLRLAGKGLSGLLRAAALAAGAEAVGYVDDMTAEFAGAAALVVPLWTGAGMRVKLVEAMAARLPFAATPMSAEGLELVPGRHGNLADTPAALADAIAALLGQPERARAQADAAYEHARARWSLEAIAVRTQALCEEAVHRRAQREGTHHRS